MTNRIRSRRMPRWVILFAAICVFMTGALPEALAQKTIIIGRRLGTNQESNDDEIIKALGSTGVTRGGVFIPGLGYNVVTKVLDAGAPDGADVEDYSALCDLLFVSQSINSGDLGLQHLDDDVPIIQTEAALFDDATGKGCMWFCNDAGTQTNQTLLTITDNSHPITEIFPLGEILAYTSAGGQEMGRVRFDQGEQATGVLPLVEIGPEASDTNQAWLSLVEKDGVMDLGGMPAALPATALQRRVCLGLMQNSFQDNGTPELVYLLQRSVQWAIGDPVTAGVKIDPGITAAADYLDFGLMAPGDAKQTQDFTITNTGGDGSTLNIETIDETALGDFGIVTVLRNGTPLAAPYQTSLAKDANDSLVVTIGVQPGAAAAAGFTSHSLIIKSDDPLNQVLTYPLSVTIGATDTGPNYNSGELIIDTTAGTWIHSDGDSFTGTITAGKYTETPGAAGPIGIEWDYGVCVFDFVDVYLGSGITTLTIQGENALRINVTGQITINTKLDLDGVRGSLVKTSGVVVPGSKGGPGGFAGGDGGAGSANITDGQGPGGGIGSGDGTWGNGGGYGGLGGTWQAPRLGGFTNGDDMLKTLLGGSGGGGSQDGAGAGGGGGAINLASVGTVTIGPRGVVSANGGDGSLFNDSNQGGGASGGGIRVEADKVVNYGVLQADGGAGGYNTGASQTRSPSGGGGRIAVLYGASLTPVTGGIVTAAAGPTPSGSTNGGNNRGIPGKAGTIVVRQSGPRVNVDPAIVDFGVIKQGDSAKSVTVTVTNSGTAGSTLNISNLDETALAPFVITSAEFNGVPAAPPLALSADAGDTLVVVLSLDPVAKGPITGSAIIVSDDTTAPNLPVNCTALVRETPPPVIDGLVMHFDSDEGVTADGANLVSSWADMSGNGNDALQGNANRQPLLVSDGLNGKAVVRFDGGSDGLKYEDIGEYTELSIIALYNSEVYSDWGSVISSDHEEYGTVHFGVRNDLDAFGCYVDEQGLTQFEGLTPAETYFAAVVDDGVEFRNYLNNEAPFNTAYDTAANKTLGPGHIGLWISNNNAFGRFFQGDIAEILVFNRALAQGEINDLGYYFQQKYTLPTTFTPPAPDLGVTPDLLDFGWVPTDAGLATRTLILSNVGSVGTSLDVNVGPVLKDNFILVDVIRSVGEQPTGPNYQTTLTGDEYLEVVIGFDPGKTPVGDESVWFGHNGPAAATEVRVFARGGDPSLPPVTGGLILHCDAGNITKTIDGSTVDTWVDASPNGNSMVRAGGAPTYVTSGLNGKPVVRFDPTNGGQLFLPDDEGEWMTFDNITTLRTGFLVVNEKGSTEQTNNPLLSHTTQQPDFSRGADYVLISDANSAAEVSGGDWWINGGGANPLVDTVPAAHSIIAFVTTANTSTNQIGRDRDEASGSFWDGDYAEIILYDRPLSSVQMAQVGNYLQTKYGITGSYTPPAPRPVIIVDPTAVDFGLVPADGPPVTRTITIRDGGITIPLEIFTITPSGANFSVASAVLNGTTSLADPYAASLASANDDILEVTVAFGSSPAGSYTGNLTIVSDDPDTPNYVVPLSAQPSKWRNQDVGDVGAAGSASIAGSEPNEVFTINGSGNDIWNAADEFHFVYQKLKGDGSITARVNQIIPPDENNGWFKAGVMMRDNLEGGSKNMSCVVSRSSGGALWQYRPTPNVDSQNLAPDLRDTSLRVPYWVRITRVGDSLTGEMSVDGTVWENILQPLPDPPPSAARYGPQTIVMPEEIYIGLCVTSHQDGTVDTGIIDNVATTGDVFPVAPPLSAPYGLDLATADDTGDSDTDDLTMSTTGLTITGTAAAGSIVTINGATAIISGTAEEFANPGLDIDLAEGTHSITAMSDDQSGGISDPSLPLTITVDATAPTLTLDSVAPSPTTNPVIPVTAVFSEAVSGFDATDVTAGNGAVGAVTAVDDANYAFDVTASAEGAVTVDVAGGAATDAAGNSSEAAAQLARAYDDGIGPITTYTLTVTIVGDGTVDAVPDQTIFNSGEQVVLTATSGVNQQFDGWSDAVTSMDNPLTVTMDGDKNITATFSTIPPPTYTLIVTVVGLGSVDIVPDQTVFNEGETAALTAVPDTGQRFVGWSDAVTSTEATINLSMDSDKTITATFEELPIDRVTLTATASAGGSVAKDPDEADYAKDAVVKVTATPDTGYKFLNWTGDFPAGMETTNPVDITLDVSKAIAAVFEEIPPVTYMLTATATGDGTVTVDPVQTEYVENSQVTLTAAANPGQQFNGWSGSVTTTTNPLTITMDDNKTITANFGPEGVTQYALTATAGAGGMVAADPAGPIHDENTTVSVTATPDDGYQFAGWTGPDVPAGQAMNPTIILTMDADKTIEATFTETQTEPLPDPADYKITWKKSTLFKSELVDGQMTLALSGGSDKSSIKIQRLKKLPKKMTEKDGTTYVLGLQLIPELSIVGAFGKITCDAEVASLTSDGAIKSITTKIVNIAAINAGSVATIKMTALRNDAEVTAGTTILTGAGADMKLTLSGIVLENLLTGQNCKYIKLASKAWKDKATKVKYVSLGGAQGEIVAAGAKSITAKGASIACDLIRVGQDVTNLKAQSKKLNKIDYAATLGKPVGETLMQVLAPNIKTIFGTAAVNGVFIAGFTVADGLPNYTGAIKSISTKAGPPVGSAYISPAAKAIKFKPSQGDFVVQTAAQ